MLRRSLALVAVAGFAGYALSNAPVAFDPSNPQSVSAAVAAFVAAPSTPTVAPPTPTASAVDMTPGPDFRPPETAVDRTDDATLMAATEAEGQGGPLGNLYSVTQLLGSAVACKAIEPSMADASLRGWIIETEALGGQPVQSDIDVSWLAGENQSKPHGGGCNWWKSPGDLNMVMKNFQKGVDFNTASFPIPSHFFVATP